jgi:hypothetical protein
MAFTRKLLSGTVSFVNIIFLLVGLVIIGAGGYALGQGEVPANLHLAYDRSVAFGLCGVGGFITLVSLVGLIGACTSSRRTLSFYACLLFAVLVAQAVIAGYASHYRESASSEISRAWTDTNNADRCWVQKEFDCMGFENPLDRPGTNCTVATEGCRDAVVHFIKARLSIVEIAAISIAGTELFLFFLTVFLTCAIGSEQRDVERTKLIDHAHSVNRQYI